MRIRKVQFRPTLYGRSEKNASAPVDLRGSGERHGHHKVDCRTSFVRGRAPKTKKNPREDHLRGLTVKRLEEKQILRKARAHPWESCGNLIKGGGRGEKGTERLKLRYFREVLRGVNFSHPNGETREERRDRQGHSTAADRGGSENT